MTPTQSPLFLAIVEGDPEAALTETQNLLNEQQDAQTILQSHLIPAMGEVGRLFDEGEYFVPDLLLSSKAMQEAMTVVNPLLKETGVAKTGTVIIGTVQGDHHDIGKNLVASMLEGNGFEVIDLGVNTSPTAFVEEVRRHEGKVVVALSALLTTTMPQMKAVIDLLNQEGLRKQVRVMVGGAPVSEQFAKDIRADGYSENANTAVRLAKKLAFASREA
ncbi:MAG: corrinoid protein [Planctomycetia bacterium]|nr:corrinoid protein [Planctomycetia bacterium]